MKGNANSKQRVTLPPASSTISDGHGAPGTKLQGACLHLRTGHTGGRQDQARWWHEQPQLQVPAGPRQSSICRREAVLQVQMR